MAGMPHLPGMGTCSRIFQTDQDWPAPMLYLVLATLLLAALLYALDSRTGMEDVRFDPDDVGDDPEAYLAAGEARIAGLREGVAKTIAWADPDAKPRRPLAIVYIHGFTATLGEIRPVPDMVAEALGANLFYTRLSGHGLDGVSLERASVAAWRRDMAEALEIGRRLGERVVLVTTSTGSAAAVLELVGAGNDDAVAGIVQISPNYRLRDPRSFILDLPLAGLLAPMVAGKTQRAKRRSELHAHFWDMEFPTRALVPMAALTRAARWLDFSATGLPALFILCEDDAIIDPKAARKVLEAWGGPTEIMDLTWEAGDDIERHVMCGDILTPAKTTPVAERIIAWIRSLDADRPSA